MGKIITTDSLQPFFYKKLSELNKKSLCPVPEQILFYSSDVLNRYTLSSDFFEMSDGRLRQKTLGVKLLEASHISTDQKMGSYREIGDTALVLCGFFSPSINEKIVDKNYYYSVGQQAYKNLHTFVPNCFNTPGFYKLLATCFENITSLVSILSESQETSPFSKHIISELETNDRLMQIQGVTPSHSKKVS